MDSESIHGIQGAEVMGEPGPEPKLLAGVFLMPDGEVSVSGRPGVDPGLLFFEALRGMYINLKKPKILTPDGPLPPFPQELTG